MQRPYAEYEEFLAAVLRNEAPAWPITADVKIMLKLGECHGVNGLVDAAYRQIAADWPANYIDKLATEARQQTGHEILRHRELLRVPKTFAENGLRPLIMKGAALAYSHYQTPMVRPRCDIDLLVADADRDASDRLLLKLGYERALAIPGPLISNEQCYHREQAGFPHLVDLHWKINNRKALARTLSYDDLLIHAIPVAALGDYAMTLSPVHSILLACMHRVASLCTSVAQNGLENFDGDRLIWLYDIHLMCGTMDESRWNQLQKLSVEHEIVAIVRDGLARCRSVFGTALPVENFDLAASRHELSAGLLNATPRQAFINDLQCLNWADRLGLIKQTLVPSRGYMRRRYGSNRPLALQYLSRAFSGFLRRRGDS